MFMNEKHQSNLEQLKSEMDDEYGIAATWLHESGQTEPAIGIFRLLNKTITIKLKHNSPGLLDVDNAEAFFSMQPDTVKGAKGDRLIINGQNFLVLPFNRGNFETIIPLKSTENKNHNWR